jgi:hypothetical protein
MAHSRHLQLPRFRLEPRPQSYLLSYGNQFRSSEPHIHSSYGQGSCQFIHRHCHDHQCNVPYQNKATVTVTATDNTPGVTLTCTLNGINHATRKPWTAVMGPASPPVAGTFTATFPNISAPSQVTVTLSAGGSATSAVTSVRQENVGPAAGLLGSRFLPRWTRTSFGLLPFYWKSAIVLPEPLQSNEW